MILDDCPNCGGAVHRELGPVMLHLWCLDCDQFNVRQQMNNKDVVITEVFQVLHGRHNFTYMVVRGAPFVMIEEDWDVLQKAMRAMAE